MRRLLAGMVLMATFVPGPARAAAGAKAAAEALFMEGRRLMSAGRFSEACPKFEASQRLDPGVGTMLNLAECYEKTGRTASAWAEFREVISAARAADSQEREALARQRAASLEGELSRLTVVMSAEASATPSIEVRRDGVVIDAAELGSAIPVDPGKHVIEATAPGKQKWFKTLEVGADGGQSSITVPALSPMADAAPSEPPKKAELTPAVLPKNDSDEAEKSSRKPLALAVGGIGVVGVGIGGFFGLRAISKHGDAKDACPTYPNGCSTSAVNAESDAKNAAKISTVAFALGGVALATGIVLWVTARPESSTSTALVVGPTSLAVKGNF